MARSRTESESGHAVGRVGQLQVEGDGVEGLILRPDAGDGQPRSVVVVVVDEEEAVGIDAAVGVEHGELVDARGERIQGDGYGALAGQGGQGLVEAGHALAHDVEGQRLVYVHGLHAGFHGGVVLHDGQGAALAVHLGQVLGVFIPPDAVTACSPLPCPRRTG